MPSNHNYGQAEIKDERHFLALMDYGKVLKAANLEAENLHTLGDGESQLRMTFEH